MKVLQELDPEGVALRKKNILEDVYTITKYVVHVKDVLITYYNREHVYDKLSMYGLTILKSLITQQCTSI